MMTSFGALASSPPGAVQKWPGPSPLRQLVLPLDLPPLGPSRIPYWLLSRPLAYLHCLGPNPCLHKQVDVVLLPIASLDQGSLWTNDLLNQNHNNLRLRTMKYLIHSGKGVDVVHSSSNLDQSLLDKADYPQLLIRLLNQLPRLTLMVYIKLKPFTKSIIYFLNSRLGSTEAFLVPSPLITTLMGFTMNKLYSARMIHITKNRVAYKN